jgi:hypothetical protein
MIPALSGPRSFVTVLGERNLACDQGQYVTIQKERERTHYPRQTSPFCPS